MGPFTFVERVRSFFNMNYLEHIKNKEVEVVKVTVPSGFVFEFRKPGVFGTLFGIGGLPQTASSGAVDEWVKQGVLKLGEGEGELPPDAVKNLNTGMAIVDRVLYLSHKPKLVSHPTTNENELYTGDVAEEDLTFLFKWVAAGGDLSAMLSTFPQGREPDALASASRKKQRAEAQSASGN